MITATANGGAILKKLFVLTVLIDCKFDKISLNTKMPDHTE